MLIPLSDYVCDKLAVIGDIAHGDHVNHWASGNCSYFEKGSDESYVLATCNVTTQDTWVRGEQVRKKSFYIFVTSIFTCIPVFLCPYKLFWRMKSLKTNRRMAFFSDVVV